MKVDLSKGMIDMDGSPCVDEKGNVLTLANVIMTSIGATLKGDENDSGEQRMRKYELYKKTFENKNGECDINTEDIAMIKQRVLLVYPGPLAYGRVCEIFGDSK